MGVDLQSSATSQALRFVRRRGSSEDVFPLTPGITRIGRAAQCQIQLEDPSVSELHCEVEWNNSGIVVRDLGSTNGTFIDGAAVAEAAIHPGQQLQLGKQFGTIEQAIASAPQIIPRPSPSAEKCASHPAQAAGWRCTECDTLQCDACVKTLPLEGRGFVALCSRCQELCERVVKDRSNPRRTGYVAGLGRALLYPFQGNSLVLLVIGTVFAIIENCWPRQLMAASTLAELAFGAYFLLYLRETLVASADGKEEAPALAAADRETLMSRVLEFSGIYLMCFGPWTLCGILGRAGFDWAIPAAVPLFVVGACYFPMALLAVVIYDDLSALNPLLVVVSIWRAIARYAILCSLLAALGGALYLVLPTSEGGTRALWSVLIVSSLSSYVAIVFVRALGWFYYCNQERLNWR